MIVTGEDRSMKDAARRVGVSYNTFRQRLRRGWTLEQAGEEVPPPARKGRIWHAFGKGKTLKEWAAETGLTESILRNRLKRGMNMEQAIEKGNKRSSGYEVLYNGEAISLNQLAVKTGLTYGVLKYRIKVQGMTAEEAVAKGSKRKLPGGIYANGCRYHADCFSCPYIDCRM